jgi:hypothetical protein
MNSWNSLAEMVRTTATAVGAVASRQSGVRGFVRRLFGLEDGGDDHDGGQGSVRRERRQPDEDRDEDDDARVGSSSRRRGRQRDRDDDDGGFFDLFGG